MGYDGTNWSTRPSLATQNGQMGTAGTGPAALCIGGNGPPTYRTQTEEFTGETSADTASTIDFD